MMKTARRSEGALCGGHVAEAQQGCALRRTRGRSATGVRAVRRTRGSVRTSLCLMARLFALRCEGAARLFL